MSDFPPRPATFVGPPDMSRLSGGQRVLDATRSDIAMSLDSEIMQRKAVLDNAQNELANYITLTEANGKVAQQNATQSLDRRINLTLGNALSVAAKYGVQPPPPSEIRTRHCYPVPEILSGKPGASHGPPGIVCEPAEPLPVGSPAETYSPPPESESGKSPQSPIPDVPPQQIDVSPAPDSCDMVLTLPKDRQQLYVAVWRNIEYRHGAIGTADVMPLGYPLKWLTFPNWWSAHFACKLINSCGWTYDRVEKIKKIIDGIKLKDQTPVGSGSELCYAAIQMERQLSHA